MDFFVKLNKKTISTTYDLNYFCEVLAMIKEYYQASDAEFVNDSKGYNIKSNDTLINISEDETIKLLIKNNKKNIENKELLASILDNMFKTKKIVERLKYEKYMDSLLKVKNRCAYDEILEKQDIYNNIGVAFIDANGLGVINNMHGYQKGDELLKNIVKSLTKNFRNTDIYRIGGDEFVVICQNISKELFYEKIVNSKVYLDTTSFSASYGIVYSEETDKLNKLVEQASIRMKKNKEEYREIHPDKYIDKYKVKYKGAN